MTSEASISPSSKKLPAAPYFDAAGDITNDTEIAITSYVGEPGEWLQFCESCWDQTYGKVRRPSSNMKSGIEFVTGGWSRNEHVIRIMRTNWLMWSLTWLSSHRGGLHRIDADGSDGNESDFAGWKQRLP